MQTETRQPVANLFGDQLSEIALIARLSTARWCGQRVDRKISTRVNNEMRASQDAGKYVKVLATKKDLAEVNHWYRKACAFHEKNTLPWHRNGEGILPTANFYRYRDGFDAIRRSFFEAVDGVIARLPEIREEARTRLGEMFSEDEFPGVGDLRQKFNLVTAFSPIPDPSDFRLDIKAEEVARLRDRYSQSIDATVEDAMVQLWRRLYEQVRRMADTLANPEQKFQKTLLENALEIVELLPRLNFSRDAALESMRRKVEEQLLSYEAGALRADLGLRLETAGAAADIAAQMEKMKPQLRSIEF